MKKRIVIGILFSVFIVVSIITNYIDSARVTTGHEPKYCIKTINYDEGKVTYWGLGYKVIRYIGVAPKEPYENNIGVKMGSWFMKYELPNEQSAKEYFFYGKVVESDVKYIIVEPNENEAIRKSSDKIRVELGEYNDCLYEMETNVKITYDGIIMESYPAMVKAAKIEVKSAEDFGILFYDKHPIEDHEIYTILDKSETDGYDYTVYGYDGQVNIKIDDKEYSLKNALLENRITMDEVIAKANNDLNEDKITGDMYRDGGSMIYRYSNYTIIKCHTLDGNRDVYIGTPNMTINDIKNGKSW